MGPVFPALLVRALISRLAKFPRFLRAKSGPLFGQGRLPSAKLRYFVTLCGS